MLQLQIPLQQFWISQTFSIFHIYFHFKDKSLSSKLCWKAFLQDFSKFHFLKPFPSSTGLNPWKMRLQGWRFWDTTTAEARGKSSTPRTCWTTLTFYMPTKGGWMTHPPLRCIIVAIDFFIVVMIHHKCSVISHGHIIYTSDMVNSMGDDGLVIWWAMWIITI